jgi:hypothetical protein
MDLPADDLDWNSELWEVIRSQSDYIEFDWFARDLAGHLAALSSFGVGPSPSPVRASRADFNSLLRVFSGLSESTVAVVDPSPPGRTDDWQRYARCGVFAYDNADIHGGDPIYKRIAHPQTPLRFADLRLPPGLVACLPCLPIVFAESLSIPFVSVPV